MKSMWQELSEGFVGSFRLAGALVMAVVFVASSFIHGTTGQTRADQHSRLHEN